MARVAQDCPDARDPVTLLHVEPGREIRVSRCQRGDSASGPLRLVNVSRGCVAFKVKTSAAGLCAVRPSVGTLLPGKSLEAQVQLRLAEDAALPAGLRFLVQATAVPTVEHCVTRDRWAKLPPGGIEKHPLGLVLAEALASAGPPPLPMPIRGRAPLLRLDPVLELRLPTEENGLQTRKFTPCEAGLTLTNVAGGPVSFKLKTTAPESIFAHPAVGVISPHGRVEVRVRFQPRDGQVASATAGSASPRLLVHAVAKENSQLGSAVTPRANATVQKEHLRVRLPGECHALS